MEIKIKKGKANFERKKKQEFGLWKKWIENEKSWKPWLFNHLFISYMLLVCSRSKQKIICLIRWWCWWCVLCCSRKAAPSQLSNLRVMSPRVVRLENFEGKLKVDWRREAIRVAHLNTANTTLHTTTLTFLSISLFLSQRHNQHILSPFPNCFCAHKTFLF